MNSIIRKLAAVAWVCAAVSARAETRLVDKTAPQEVLNFALLDHRGRLHELRRTDGKAVVLFFTANGCPIARKNASKLKVLREKYLSQGIQFFMVNSSTGDDRSAISKEAAELKVWHLPVLKDDTQGLAQHLGVKRTAETIAINTKDWTVFYRGALDDQFVEGAQKPQPTHRYLETALSEFLAGKPVSEPKTVARGCVIQFEGAGAAPTPVSYEREVVPVLKEKCVQCHSPGNIGSWSMSGHKKIKSMAGMIEEVLLTRRMPPWDADPQYGKFTNDSSLKLSEAQTLLRWIHQGAPKGDEPDPLANLPDASPAAWPLGEPDLVLRLPTPQEIPATGVLNYRHVEVLANNAREGWVAGVWVRPGNKKVLHHVIARLKDGAKDHIGEREMFVGWAPGSTQGLWPKGSGKYIPANARFDFELHYTPDGAAQTDQTEIGVYLLQEKPQQRFESVPLVNNKFEIQPGDPDSQTSAMFCFQKPATLHSLTPHMHLRGRWMKFEVLYPNGKRETVCSVPRYDFNWQTTYVLTQPKKIPAGTWVMLTGGFDNSGQNPSNPDPTQAITWGDQSFEEMFLGWYNVTWDLPQSVAQK